MRPAALALLAAAIAGCGGNAAGPPVDEALRTRLVDGGLSVRSVACVDSGLRYGGAPVFRCNVNFGDPHIVPYCAALLEGALATDRERKDMRCYRPEDEQRYREGTLLEE
jgi:hypothetical protein